MKIANNNRKTKQLRKIKVVVSGIRIGGMGRGQAGDLFFILSFSVFDFCDHVSELLG